MLKIYVRRTANYPTTVDIAPKTYIQTRAFLQILPNPLVHHLLRSLIMAMHGIKTPAVPFGSLVVVSGVSGLIGSHVADQALAAGYKVRGTTRSVAKNAWVADYFQRKYGAESFGLIEVSDMEAEGAFEDATRGNEAN